MLKIVSTEHFELPGTGGRFIHCGEIHDVQALRTYICFYDTWTHNKYIEEITGGKLRQVEDDDRWAELAAFAELHEIFPTFIQKDESFIIKE